jgi:hypothetical protein
MLKLYLRLDKMEKFLKKNGQTFNHVSQQRFTKKINTVERTGNLVGVNPEHLE